MSLQSVPSFYSAKSAGSWAYHPDPRAVFEEAQAWRAKKGVKPSASDKKKVRVLAIDMQKDFCLPEGTLYVGGRSGTGAIDDSRRTAEFIYRNLDIISQISCTLDTHVPYQIFSRSFWVKRDGSPVDAMTQITAKMVREGEVGPSLAAAAIIARGNIAWLREQCIYYCEELEKSGKYTLMIWPEHCLLGTDGHALVGVMQEAALFHSFARGSQLDYQIKGGNPLTENYSVLRPEVLSRFDGQPIPGAQKNAKFVQSLLEDDYVVIPGQALSHCVKSSIDDLLSEIVAKDPKLAKKVYILEDCMSSVAVPDGKGGFFVDFTSQGEEALSKFRNAGMHVVKSTTPVEKWPDFVVH